MSDDNAKFDKIARMALFDIPQTQIAKAVGLSDSRISQIVETEEYKTVLSAISIEYFERNQQLNDGWQSVEALALGTVVDNLAWNKDPDFALRAAMIANKAQKRGETAKQPIDAQAGARAVFHLTQNFIQKLQHFGGENKTPDGEVIENKPPAQKDADYMVPEKVEALFVVNQPKVKKPEDLLNFFPQVDLVPAE